jgi:signal transduction histidine kinase
MDRSYRLRVSLWLTAALLMLGMTVSCDRSEEAEMDRLNEMAYSYHYRNLDSTRWYAERSLRLADSCGMDRAEAINHLAFVSLARMQYGKAAKQLRQVEEMTNNQVELLVADVQMMRLCQRKSRNKDFYRYRDQAEHRLQRINEEPDRLTPHQIERVIYARSEFRIVESSYFYYVGLNDQSIKSLEAINPSEIQQDTAQLLNYWYNIGAGGILTEGTPMQIEQGEFDYLMRCYFVSTEHHFPFWQAQAMQAMSEHLEKPAKRKQLLRINMYDMRFINVDQMPDSLLAGYLAQRAYNLFKDYGDVYQVAGASRTLAECYWQIKDYKSALICLQRALQENKAINQAPDLVASVREQLSLVYSAVDDKVNSDINRNIYLDIQEQTRQDRQLEARASQLDASSRQLNLMLAAVIVMLLLVVILLVVIHLLRRRSDANFNLDSLLEPLNQWRQTNEKQMAEREDQYEEIQEQTRIVQLHISNNKRRNIEQRAKIQLVNSVQPLIDRMVNEVNRLQMKGGSGELRKMQYQYVTELTDTINDYNNVLTQWIQMRQGEVRLNIESFPLQTLFDTVARGRMSYQIKGLNLEISPTTAIVKADKTLTLFMINTMADNARKFTPRGGTISISAEDSSDYVEIAVSDNGCGMNEDQLSHIFDRTYTGGHGFGLKNCNGIIEKYKKMSRIFSVCALNAESKVGKGTRISFRLPKGIARIILLAAIVCSHALSMSCRATEAQWPSPEDGAQTERMARQRRAIVHKVQEKMQNRKLSVKERRLYKRKATEFADSAYFSNINGKYLETMRFADSCHHYLQPNDTVILLDISNETAVAALALHRWDVYEKNNTIYTRLFREASADNTLPEYVRVMQQGENSKTVAIIILVLLIAVIWPAYYMLYYRYMLNYRFCIDRINAMNRLLLKPLSNQEKLRGIDSLSDFRKFNISDEQQENLRIIVRQIHNALQTSIDHASLQETSTELAVDELRRLQLDNSQLHISNSVLDNCLSTLKHETMYYPSRIRHLIDGTDANLQSIAELAGYYKELYQILSLQAMKQIHPLPLDGGLLVYLRELLRKVNHDVKPVTDSLQVNKDYVEIKMTIDQLVMTEEQCKNLFTPYTPDLSFLICRQIVREMGEATNLRACGITAELNGQNRVLITLIMPEKCLSLDPALRQMIMNHQEKNSAKR